MKLQLGIDYYLEGGEVILSREYLLRRGYCCNHRCKNCPYVLQEGEESLPFKIDLV